MSRDPFAHHLRLKAPCANCPVRVQGAIELEPGRVDEILQTLLHNDTKTFQCHKTVHSKQGGEWDEDDNYRPSGHEAMCAGVAAVLMKRGRPTVMMRVAFALGSAEPHQWDAIKPLVID